MHLLVLLLFVSTMVFDGFVGRPLLGTITGPVSLATAASLTLAPMLALTIAEWWVVSRCARRIDQTGQSLYVKAAQSMGKLYRRGITLLHLLGVFVFGWATALRRCCTGDVIVLDEFLIALPALALFCLGWIIEYQIERRLREAEILSFLDRGKPIHHAAGRWAFVGDQFRHHVLIVLVPIIAIIAWLETVALGLARARESGLIDESATGYLAPALEFAGIVLVVLCMPLVLRHIWRTRPLAPGALRDKLMHLCNRTGVRCRELLVWLTHGMMYNGAVVGLFGGSRYILLTDGLLEEMDELQVEAVMAHELGHVVHHHIGWLMASLIGSAVVAAGLIAFTAEFLAGLFLPDADPQLLVSAAQLVTVVAALAVGLSVFGHVSRRFERQADAFAVRLLARRRAEAHGVEANTIDALSPSVMSSALDRIAELNHIPRSSFMWRHGSISSRQRSIESLAGQPIVGTTVDRRARAAKLAVLIIVLIAAALVALGV